MAHFVGKKLKIRPSEILDTWSVSELIVAFGKYANELAQQNYSSWEINKKGEPPRKYVVRFYKGI